VYQETIKTATNEAVKLLAPAMVNLSYDVLDSCDEPDTITTIIQITQMSKYDVIIGPGHVSLCEITARLTQSRNLPLISWRCADNVLQTRDVFSSFSRTVPSMRDISHAVTKSLYHFKWKNVALLTLNTEPFITLANDVLLTLSKEGFEVKIFREMTSDPNDDDVTSVLSKIPSDVKGEYLPIARVYCLNKNNKIVTVMTHTQSGSDTI
jgi:hypothetical protein